MSPDLDMSLLYRMMRELVELRAHPNPASTQNFEGLVDKSRFERHDDWHRYLSRHLDFLEQAGFIQIKARLDEDRAGIRLTLAGQTFVQPALAELGRQPLMPEVVKSIEEQIHALTQPQQEKETLLFKLRAAVAKQMPDLIVKLAVEIGVRLAKGGQ